jgi:hypothetical protein
MTSRLKPYGSDTFARDVAKVGKSKTPISLARRMPSPEIASKVGGAQHIAAEQGGGRTHRLVRRRAQG